MLNIGGDCDNLYVTTIVPGISQELPTGQTWLLCGSLSGVTRKVLSDECYYALLNADSVDPLAASRGDNYSSKGLLHCAGSLPARADGLTNTN